MNGNSRNDRIATCNGIDAIGLVHAIDRIPSKVRLLAEQIENGIRNSRFRDGAEILLRSASHTAFTTRQAIESGIASDGKAPVPPPELEWIRPLADARNEFLCRTGAFENRM